MTSHSDPVPSKVAAAVIAAMKKDKGEHDGWLPLDRRVIPTLYDLHVHPKCMINLPAAGAPQEASWADGTQAPTMFDGHVLIHTTVVQPNGVQVVVLNALELDIKSVSYAVSGVSLSSSALGDTPPTSAMLPQGMQPMTSTSSGGSSTAGGGGTAVPSSGTGATTVHPHTLHPAIAWAQSSSSGNYDFDFRPVAQFTLHPATEAIEIDIGHIVPVDAKLILNIRYHGVVNNAAPGASGGKDRGERKSQGLFRTDEEDGRFLATQLEPTHARRLFPCFDDPTFRSPFRVSVTHPAKVMCLSSSLPRETRIAISPAQQGAGGGIPNGTAMVTPPARIPSAVSVLRSDNASESSPNDVGLRIGQHPPFTSLSADPIRNPSFTSATSSQDFPAGGMGAAIGTFPVRGATGTGTGSASISNDPNKISPTAGLTSGGQQQQAPQQQQQQALSTAVGIINETYPPPSPNPIAINTTNTNNPNALAALPQLTSYAVPNDYDGDITTLFEDTASIPPYLVAIVLGLYHSREATTKRRGITVRVFIPTSEPLSDAMFTLDLLHQAVDYYEDYFHYDLPVKKLDIVALREFESLGMENWGLMTFHYDYCVVNKHTPFEVRRRICRLVGHEVSHQWFGNIVSLASWKYIWLKEGFARYLEYVFVTHHFTQWSYWGNFITDVMSPCMAQDCSYSELYSHRTNQPYHPTRSASVSTSTSSSSTTTLVPPIDTKATVVEESEDAAAGGEDDVPEYHPWCHPVELPGNPAPRRVFDYFDSISYGKGASILRMIGSYVGDAQFASAVKLFVSRYAFKYAHSQDLFDCIQQVVSGQLPPPAASAAPATTTTTITTASGLNLNLNFHPSPIPHPNTSLSLPQGISVATIMKQWVTSVGHPCLYTTVNKTTGALTIYQTPMTPMWEGFLKVLQQRRNRPSPRQALLSGSGYGGIGGGLAGLGSGGGGGGAAEPWNIMVPTFRSSNKRQRPSSPSVFPYAPAATNAGGYHSKSNSLVGLEAVVTSQTPPALASSSLSSPPTSSHCLVEAVPENPLTGPGSSAGTHGRFPPPPPLRRKEPIAPPPPTPQSAPFLLPIRIQELVREQSSVARTLLLTEQVTTIHSASASAGVLINVGGAGVCRTDYDMPLWTAILDNYRALPTVDRVSVLVNIFEMRAFLIGVTSSDDTLDRCTLLLRALYEVGERKETHFTIWAYLASKMALLVDFLHVYPCWDDVRYVLDFAARSLVASGACAFHRTPPEAATDFKRSVLTAAPTASILRTLCFGRDAALIEQATEMFLWVMEAWTDSNAPMPAIVGANTSGLLNAAAPVGTGTLQSVSPVGVGILSFGDIGGGSNPSGAANLNVPTSQTPSVPTSSYVLPLPRSNAGGPDSRGVHHHHQENTGCDLDELSLPLVETAFEVAIAHSTDIKMWWAVVTVYCHLAGIPLNDVLEAFDASSSPASSISMGPSAAAAANAGINFHQEHFRINHFVVVSENSKRLWLTLLLSAIVSCPLVAAQQVQIFLLCSTVGRVEETVCRSVFRNSRLFPKLMEYLIELQAATEMMTIPTTTSAAASAGSVQDSPLWVSLSEFAVGNCANDMFLEYFRGTSSRNGRSTLQAVQRNCAWADFASGHFSWYCATVLLKKEGVLPSWATMPLGGDEDSGNRSGNGLGSQETPLASSSPDSARRCSI